MLGEVTAGSPALNTSQNSSFAVVCNNLLALSGFSIPGSSTVIWSRAASNDTLGWITPNLSIRFLSRSKVSFTVSSALVRNILSTVELDVSLFIWVFNPGSR